MISHLDHLDLFSSKLLFVFYCCQRKSWKQMRKLSLNNFHVSLFLIFQRKSFFTCSQGFSLGMMNRITKSFISGTEHVWRWRGGHGGHGHRWFTMGIPWRQQPNTEETQKKRSFQVPASCSCGRMEEQSSVLMDVCWEIRELRWTHVPEERRRVEMVLLLPH